MAPSEFLENYKLAEPTVRKLYNSKLRLAILDALKDGPLRLADLRRAVNANAPNTSSKAKELEEMGLVERVGGDFQLTRYGRATLEKLSESVAFHFAYEKFKEFWETHDTGDIPDELLAKIGMLSKANFIKADQRDITKPITCMEDYAEKTKKGYTIIGPFDWFFSDRLADIIMRNAKRGVKGKYITNEETLRNLFKEHKRYMQELVKTGNMQIFVFPRVMKFASTVADNFFSFGLFSKKTGNYDVLHDLMTDDPKAIEWCYQFSEYYEKKSKLINPSDYL
jgi:predicted transcriptional regulator